ncbi:MAG TPA: hypothetical protein VFH73_23925 [Polyangia bacterium]|nr:hypothetical protein [Polyangia bacterium]
MPAGRAVVVALGALVLVAVVGWPGAVAWGYDFSIDVRTVGQGYQVRRYAPNGGNELLTRRRLTQYLNLNVYNIEPERWRDPERERNTLYVDVSLRFDSDFGGYMLARPTGINEIRELQQNQVDILYAYVGGRDMGGRVDFQLGRQVHYDLVDFYAFDGATVAVRLHRPLVAQAFAGTEVHGELPLSSPLYQQDGTSIGSQDPATRPAQARQLRPLAGAALALEGWEGLTARLAYRRTWSYTADRLDGEPGSGVNDEKVALTATANWRRRVYATLGVRYNLLLASADDQQLGVRVRVGDRHWLGAEHAYLAPTFDGDSIWNIFAAGAYRDLRATYEVVIADGVRAHARAFARFFERAPGEVVGGVDPGAGAPGGRVAAGGNAGASWRRSGGVLRADVYFDDGYGGRKAGGDASGRYTLHPGGVELEGRLTGYHWRSDLQPQSNTGVVFGAQAGTRFPIAEGMRLYLLAEDNVGTFYRSQYRGLAILEIDVSL